MPLTATQTIHTLPRLSKMADKRGIILCILRMTKTIYEEIVTVCVKNVFGQRKK